MQKYYVVVLTATVSQWPRTTWFSDPKCTIKHRVGAPAVEYENGDSEWYANGKYHREDGPAVDFNSTKEWFVDGKHHRVGGPAIDSGTGFKAWFVDGNRHRIDGPAIEYADGDYCWYVDGKQHRLDGPASVTNITKEWIVNGKHHRIDGPAIEYADGDKYWYLEGQVVSQEEHARRITPAQEMTVAQIEAALGKRIKVVK